MKVKAVENLDSIISVPELDMIYIGVYDLSKEYGFDMYSEEMKELFKDIATKVRRHNKELGAIYKDKETRTFGRP